MKNKRKSEMAGIKKTKVTNDVEYSCNLTPSTSRLKEAGYGKSMDLELAEVGQNQALTENQIDNTRSDTATMKNAAETNPLTTITRSNNEMTHQNSEFSKMDVQNNPRHNLINPGFTGFETGTAGEHAGDHESEAINETGKQASSNFEFGNMNKKNKLPTPKSLQ